ncbi:LacI family DNA-binding transcriptional regulator [Streptosporangium subroseum]|uniref:LacI family DNA-binding transcriptional regulator n=1 Tax=Streptosporangium subroseum TaxID=106412 RepID=UPI00343ED79A
MAVLAGVSVATASEPLDSRADVRKATGQPVPDAAARLGFPPNALAQGLLPGQSRTAGLLTGDMVGRFGTRATRHENAFGTGKTAVPPCDARGDALREQHHVRTLLSHRVDDLIVAGESTDPRPSITKDVPVPWSIRPGPRRRSR